MTGAAALDGVEQWSIFGEGDHDKDCIHVDSQSIDVPRKPYDAVAVKKKLNVEAIEYRQNLWRRFRRVGLQWMHLFLDSKLMQKVQDGIQ